MSDCAVAKSAADRDVGAETAADKALFEPTAEMMVNDFDDERTLDEEEALAAGERQDPTAELSSLQREGDMPLEELLALYGLNQREAARAERVVEAGPRVAEVAGREVSEEDKPEPSPLRRLYGGDGEPPRFLRSVSRPPSEEEEDCDYSPEEDDWKKTIMVGSDYQAWIPEGLCGYDDAPPYENEDRLLWNPAAIEEAAAENYMARVGAMAPAGAGVEAVPAGPRLRDDEQALYLLQQCGHSVEEALRRRRMSAADAPAASPASLGLWSEEECRNFEQGLKAHGKDFRLIRQHKVRTRSVGELVQFYYIWKKTERHDMFANKARLEKKKYNMHPGHTDYMDRFLEEQDGGGARERSASPGGPQAGKGSGDRDRDGDAPPDPLAVGGREVFSELRRNSPARSPGADDTDREMDTVL